MLRTPTPETRGDYALVANFGTVILHHAPGGRYGGWYVNLTFPYELVGAAGLGEGRSFRNRHRAQAYFDRLVRENGGNALEQMSVEEQPSIRVSPGA
jgi:hypothetical protein